MGRVTDPVASGRSALARLRRFLRGGSGFDRAIVIAVGVAITCVWIVVLERLQFEKSEAVNAAFRETMNLTVASEEHAVRTIEDIEQTLELVMRDYRTRGRGPRLKDLFDQGAITTGLYNFLAVVDEHGDFVASTADFAPTNVSDREYFEWHQRNPGAKLYIGTPTMGRASGRLIVPVTRRVDKADGSFGGVVVASVDPSYFTTFYRKVYIGERGLIALVGLDGVARARRVGETIRYGDDMSGTTFFGELSARPSGSFRGQGLLDGVRRFSSYRTLAQHPLAIEVGFAEGDVLAAFHEREHRYFGVAAGASALLCLIAVGFIVAARRQRRANGELWRNEARYRATFDEAAVGIIHVDVNGRFLRANTKFCELLGYTEAELRELTFADLTHPEDRAVSSGLRSRLLDADSTAASTTIEKRYMRKDGSVVWVTIAAALVRDVQGRADYFVTIVRDIGARKQAEERYRATFNQAAVGIGHVSLDGRFILANGKLAEMLGYSPGEMANVTIASIVPPDEMPAVHEARVRLQSGEAQLSAVEFRYVRKDGSRGWAIRTLAPVRNGSGTIEYFITVVQDITERKHAEAALQHSNEQFEQLVNHIPEAFWIMNVERNELVYLSPAYERLCGVRFDSLRAASRGWLDTIHPDDRARAIATQQSMTTETLDQRFRIVLPDGAIRWVHVRGFPVRDESGRVYRVAGTIEDTTERQLLVERLQYQAHYDALTDLPNRVLCVDRLKQTLGQAKRKQWLAGVLYLDLDRFKVVNDTLGHMFGDELLRQVSQRLAMCVRAGDTIGRLGGDEFAIVLSELTQSQDAGLVAQKVLDALAAPFHLDGHDVFITASIGIATYPGDGGDADALLKNADAAMFSAKSLGKNNYQFYTAAMNARALERLLLESNLRRALERAEFVLHLQPKASIGTGVIVGCEALLRWQVPGNGLVSPAQFIPLLEESGLIVPVGEWVVRSACAQLRAWQDAGIAPVPVAVNLSPRQFQHQDVCEVVSRALRDFAIDPALLEIEITESAAMHNAEAAIVTLSGLKALGVRIAIDDFGTGYSSLSYLKRFPVDSLKLDRSFVKDLPGDAEDAAISRAVIHLAHSLGLEVVAEGVETQSQLAFLAANGCDVAQGYYLSRPVPAAQIAQMLVQGRPLKHACPTSGADSIGRPETAVG